MSSEPKNLDVDLTKLSGIVNLKDHPLSDSHYRRSCKQALDNDGVLVLKGFLCPDTINSVKADGDANRHLAFFTSSDHNVYLQPPSSDYASDHPRNRSITSSKGCITTDQIPSTSTLHTLYENSLLKDFLCTVLDENALHEYADSLSSINLHYAANGQELGWHFDNSSFAITLLIQEPADGGHFEYVRDVRDADKGDMNFESVAAVLDGDIAAKKLDMQAGDLVLFRGRNSLHRVTPTIGDQCRMLVVLAYNSTPGVVLSESARMTFYGRLGSVAT